MLAPCPSNTGLWPAERSQAVKMPRLLPQFLPVLAVYCFCMLQIPASGVSQPSVEPPDGLNTVQLELPAVHPLMRLASKLASGKMKRFPQPDLGAASVDFTKKDPIATLGRPFFLFRSRNGRNLEDKAQSVDPGFKGKGKTGSKEARP
ncbi:neuromedin-S isoform X2 [Ictidomys tridecemlineatus]|uniref:neuromedin-S isoform X3 n=1 Tax=Ictidomys tridecemlineatus TaxID=43179 RepID=UPI001A9D2011|nr:neuromedin-S isoform X3 [Ictidomys tridecemlineatus]